MEPTRLHMGIETFGFEIVKEDVENQLVYIWVLKPCIQSFGYENRRNSHTLWA